MKRLLGLLLVLGKRVGGRKHRQKACSWATPFRRAVGRSILLGDPHCAVILRRNTAP